VNEAQVVGGLTTSDVVAVTSTTLGELTDGLKVQTES
jgi:hypothetical protein